MKRILKFLPLFVLALLMSSCQDVVQVKLDQGSKLYVIDAFITDQRTPQVVKVTTNDNYFSTTEAPVVENASVVLTDLNTNVNYSFTYAYKGNYIFNPSSADTIARINHQYRLSVTIDGSVYTSLVTQKRPASIDSIHAIYEDGTGGFGGGNRKPFYRCELVAKDKADNTPDYYWVKTFRNDTLFADAGDINLSTDGTSGEVTDFDKDSADFTAPITFLSFKRYYSGDVIKVEIHSIAHETLNFLNQAINQINNGGLFALTPENVKTNIVTPKEAKTKAVGWFSMATVVTKKRVIP